MTKLYIIAGHGADDPGAVGGGYNEAERVRALASRIKALGGSAVEVLDTKRDWYADNGISSLSLPSGACLIELHMDSASPSARGGHVIINQGFAPDAYDNALAKFIGGYFPGRSELISKRGDLANPARAAARGINYRLLEVCFITNSGDLAKFNGNLDAIAKGILGAFGIGANGGKAEWVKDSKGWWYRRADGTWPKSQWEKIAGDWYWFGADGYAVSSCCKLIGGKWYAFDKNCKMKTAVKVDKNGALVL